MNPLYRRGLMAMLLLYSCSLFGQKAAPANRARVSEGVDSAGVRHAVDSPRFNQLDLMVVTASRTAQKRTEAPIAISTITPRTIADTKANQLDQLLNKVSGVFMVDLGNEQHEMSIRQPMSTASVFLYMEDGIPIRTTGIYNHNALLEMNATAARQIEIIRGPASSLYGAEAIGGAVNIITQEPPSSLGGQASVQASNNGYKRVDVQAGNTFDKLGLLV